MIEMRKLHTRYDVYHDGLSISKTETVVVLQYRYLDIGIGKDGNFCTPEWSDWIDVKDVYENGV